MAIMRQKILESPCELSIIMPCLNEAETLATCIDKARKFLNSNNISGEVLIADNGSTDGSQTIAKNHGVRIVDVPDRGYGNALMAGIKAARGEYIIMGDADDSYDFTSLSPFLVKLREGYDLVMGNRFKGGIKPGSMPFLHKHLGTPALTGIGRLFFHSTCGDFNCGLRGFRKNAILDLNLQASGMEYASEMIVKATLRKLRIAEVPTTLSPDGRSRRPHLRSWHDGWRHLRFLLLYSPRWLFLYPGLLLMLLGLIVGLWILPKQRVIGNITLDVHTLLYSAVFISVGFQSVIFSIFTKTFAIKEGLLPDDPQLKSLFRIFTLEKGLVIGSIFTIVGLACSIYALVFWSEQSFGSLDYSKIMRIVIPASLLLTLGCQVILSSLFLSVLGLHRHKNED